MMLVAAVLMIRKGSLPSPDKKEDTELSPPHLSILLVLADY